MSAGTSSSFSTISGNCTHASASLFYDQKKRKVENSASDSGLSQLYKIMAKNTDLFYGVDKELDDLPSKRVRRTPSWKTGTGEQLLHF